MGFTNWLPGLEESQKRSPSRHCMQLSLHNDFKWAADNCMQNRNFICEISKHESSTKAPFGRGVGWYCICINVIYFHTSVKFRMFRPLLSSVYFHISSCICSYEHTLNLHRSLNFLTELFAGIMLPRSYLFGPIPSIQYFVSSKNLFLKWSIVWVLWIWVISLS